VHPRPGGEARVEPDQVREQRVEQRELGVTVTGRLEPREDEQPHEQREGVRPASAGRRPTRLRVGRESRDGAPDLEGREQAEALDPAQALRHETAVMRPRGVDEAQQQQADGEPDPAQRAQPDAGFRIVDRTGEHRRDRGAASAGTATSLADREGERERPSARPVATGESSALPNRDPPADRRPAARIDSAERLGDSPLRSHEESDR
jgi:hypothetical protein